VFAGGAPAMERAAGARHRMNNMNVTIRRLTTTFLIFLLLVSGVAAYVQVANQAFFNGPALAHNAKYDGARSCPPFDAPVRGTIYDRTGIPLAWSWPDPNAKNCGYTRTYSDAAVKAGLGPLLGYYSDRYGVAGIESAYNDELSGTGSATSVPDQVNKIFHRPTFGNDIYLTIDLRLQQKAYDNYDGSAIFKHSAGSPCQPSQNPPGASIVEDPKTGEILAMVSRPAYDPNRIAQDDDAYFQQLANDKVGAPLLNHATQSLVIPGSTFKTMTLLAALDNGESLTDQQFDQAAATHFQPFGSGFDVKWKDYLDGQWAGLQFPISLQDGFAYSDNTIFAREAVKVGKDKWLGYAQKFGIAVPGRDVPVVPFDGMLPGDQKTYQSRVYPQLTNGKPTDFDLNLLANSGFGQGDLQITPLTMSEIAGAVATGGQLFEPYVVRSVVAHTDITGATDKKPPQQVQPPDPTHSPKEYVTSGSIFQRPDTAAKARQAMWAVSSYGTGATVSHNGKHLADSAIHQGGKTGTGEAGDGSIATTWWLSLAPDDQAPNSGPAQLTFTLLKERAGEGACQAFVGEDTYEAARQLNYLKV